MANNTGTFFNINDNDGIPLVGVSTDGKVMINHLYGNCLIGSTSVTGTASQPLQVTGGAYVSGSVGVGTNNPTRILDIYSASGSNTVKLTANGTSAGFVVDSVGVSSRGGYYSACQGGVQRAVFGVSGTVEGNTTSDAAIFADGTGGNIRFYSNGSSTEVARITSSGRLLMGTSSSQIGAGANDLLQVAGAINVISSTNVYSRLLPTASGLEIIANAYPANLGSTQSIILKSGTSGGGGPSEIARFTSDGNIKLTSNAYQALAHKNFGYSGSYGAVVIGATGNSYTNVSLGVDVSTIAGGNFPGQNQVIFPSNGAIVPNNAGTNFIGVFSRNSSDSILIGPASSGGISDGPLTVTSTTVGIGTTNPTQKLDVNGNINLVSSGNYIQKTFADNTEEYILRGPTLSSYYPTISYTRSTGTSTRGFKFGANDNLGNRSDWMTIWNGAVGIGSTLPTTTLDVNGTAKVKGDFTVTNGDLYITRTDGIGGDIIANGGTDAIFGIFNSTNSGTISLSTKDSGGTYVGTLSVTSTKAQFTRPIEFAGDGYSGGPSIRIRDTSAGQISFYDVKDPDSGVYNYTLNMDSAAFRFAMSGTNAAYDYGTERANIDSSGNFNKTSDVKLKTNIQTIPNALEKTLNLRGVEYDRKDSGKHEIGLIAQEVELIIPEVVSQTKDGTKTVSYSNLIALLIESIKELKDEVETLKNIVNDGK